MILSELPHLEHALSVLALDTGAKLQAKALIPEKWVERAKLAEVELSKLDAQQVEDFAIGEETEQEKLRASMPHSSALFEDAFDGDLGDVFYDSIRSAFDYADVELTAAALTHWKRNQPKC